MIQKLHTPANLDEALALLGENPMAKAIAGGTDLLVKNQQRTDSQGLTLVSLRKIKTLNIIEEQASGEIHIGPLATFSRLTENDIVRRRLPLLIQAAEAMGGPQIRNMATIGGNICNGATSGDSAPSLFCLNALLQLAEKNGLRTVPIVDFYKGPSKVDLRPGELLTNIIIPAPGPGFFGSWYTKFSTRKAMDISIMGCAATCRVGIDGEIKEAAIALGTAAPTPVRCARAEAAVIGRKLTAGVLEQAAGETLHSINPRSSWRAGAEYRRALAVELVRETILKAYQMAGGEIHD